jgi:transposase InsO family protein
MCEVLEISPKTYYKYRNIPDKDFDDYQLIRKIFNASMKTYGYRRITDELKDRYGIVYNTKKVLRIMRKYGVQPLYIKNQQRNSSKIREEKFMRPDLLRRDFNQRGWVTDVTYLDYAGKRSFLSTILNLQSRKIIATQISLRNDIKLVLDTLHKALRKIKDPSGLVLHSDQGFQYFSTEYRSICASKGILVSMSRKGTPLDNAVIESFHSLLKKETLYNNDIKNHEEYIKLVKSWLIFYNTRRRKNKK